MRQQPQSLYAYHTSQNGQQYQQRPATPLHNQPQQQHRPPNAPQQQHLVGMYQHPTQPQPTPTPQPIAQQETAFETADPHGSAPWRRGSIVTVVFLILATFLVFVGLAAKTVMYVDYVSALLKVDTKFTIDYYEYKATAGDQTATADLNDGTCGQGGPVKFAGALHFFALFTGIAGIVTLFYEIITTKVLMAASTALISTNVGLLFLHSIVLGAVRSKASTEHCDTVPPGLLRYGVGACWGCAIGGLIFAFIGFIFYISARHCKCCCYTASQDEPQVVQVAVKERAATEQGVVLQRTEPVELAKA